MKTEIIAEIAQGYEGNSKLAALLVKGAIVANADAIKMQLVYADELCVPSYPYYSLFASLEMKEEVWAGLVKMVHDAGKKIYFDVYGPISISLALKLGADAVKISTTDFYNTPLVKEAFSSFSKVIISTGGVPIEDLDKLMQSNPLPEHVILMHGFQAEPTATADNNLKRMMTLKNLFPKADIGFMDHSLGSSEEAFHLPLIALGAGASCIEKHITLDYSLEIEDYISALSIDRFAQLVTIIRQMESSLGSKELILTEKEIEYKKKAGKLVVAKNDMEKGKLIAETDIEMKRVSTTPTDKHFSKPGMVIGKTLLADIKKDEPFEIDSVK
jgi:N,N'-diacetyllegionaminate synthase